MNEENCVFLTDGLVPAIELDAERPSMVCVPRDFTELSWGSASLRYSNLGGLNGVCHSILAGCTGGVTNALTPHEPT